MLRKVHGRVKLLRPQTGSLLGGTKTSEGRFSPPKNQYKYSDFSIFVLYPYTAAVAFKASLFLVRWLRDFTFMLSRRAGAGDGILSWH